jgi:hypothetical protein
VVLDAPLTVEAQVLRDGPVGLLTDVLAGDRVQPGSAFGAGQGKGGAVRAVDDHGAVGGGALFAERVAVVPHRPDVRSFGDGNC